MTDSPQHAASTAPHAVVLADGHLHPGMLFLRLVDGLRQSLLPVAVAIVAGQAWLAVASAVLLLLGLAFAVVRFVSFRYRLTTDELVTTEGVLHRQERRIPVDRIQDLSFESTVLRRLFGLVVVSVETASGQGFEARLDSLSRRDARALREALYRLRGRAAASGEPRSDTLLLHRAQLGELVLLGLTDNRLGAILVGLLGIYELADEFGLGGRLGSFFGGSLERAASVGTPWLVVLSVALGFLVLIAGWAFAVIGSIALYHGFALTEREDVLQRRYGLFTTRAQTLPRRKIQRVLIEASPLRRLLDVAAVRADSAGSGTQQEDQRRGGRDVVVPLVARARAERIVARVLPGVEPATTRFRPVSRRVILRTTVKSVAVGSLVALLGWSSLGPLSLAAVGIAALLGIGAGIAAYANLGYALAGDHVAFRWGILGRHRAFVPFRKVQGVVLRATPFERLAGLARVVVQVAGGSPTTLANLPRREAETLCRAVVAAATRTRFVW